MKTLYSLAAGAILLAGIAWPAQAQTPAATSTHIPTQAASHVRQAIPAGSFREVRPGSLNVSSRTPSSFQSLGTANPASRLSRLPDIRKMIAEANTESGSANRSTGTPRHIDPQSQIGNWQWAKRFGARDSIQTESSHYLTTDASGNIYMCFNYKGTVEMGSSTFTSNTRSWDIMVVSYTAQGTQRWVKTFGGSGVEIPAGLEVDPSGNLRLAAVSTGSINFGNGISYNYQAGTGITTLFTLNISTFDGTPLFVRNMWGSASSSLIVGYDMDIDVNGNAIIVGQISGDYNVTGGSGGSGNDEAFVASFSGIPSGSGANWLYRVSETVSGDAAVFTGVAVSGTNRIYCAGQFSGTVAFETTGTPSLSSQGGTDGLLLYIAPDGAWHNARIIGSTGDDGFNAIGIGPNNHSYPVGFFGGDLTFSNGLTVTYLGGGADIMEFECDSITAPLFISNGGGDALESAYDVDVSAQNITNIAGFYNGTATFDGTSLTSAGGSDPLVWRINNTAGVTQGLLSVEGTAGEDVFSRVKAGATTNDLFASGTFTDHIDFTSSLSLNTRQTTGGQEDAFLAKIGASCNFNPSFNIQVSGPTCMGSTVILSATGVPAGSTYAWTGPNNLSSSLSSLQITLSAATNGQYNLVLTNGGCSSSAQTLSITADAVPPTPTISPVTRCGSGSVTLSPTGGGAGSNYRWYSQASGGPLIGQSGSTYDVSIFGTTTYYVTTLAANNCESARVPVTATMDQPFSASISPGDVSICQGETATLTAQPAGRTYSWSNNMGSQSITVSTGGLYAVTVGQAPACTSTTAVSVTVNTRPSAAFAYGASTYCQAGTNPSPQITGTQGGTFRSSGGLSINASTGVINLAASTPGSYQVTYRVGGQCRDSATASVTISTNPVAGFNYGASAVCQASGGQLLPNFGTGASAGIFTSHPAGLNLNSANGNIQLGLSAPGTYTIVNSIAASGGCAAARDSVTLTINPSPQLTVAASPSATACEGDRVVLHATSSVPGTITWSPSGTGDSIIVTSSGTYSASATIGACQGSSSPVTVTFTARPAVPNINQTAVGGGFLLSITGGQPGTTYNWYWNGNLVTTTHSAQLSVFDPSLSGAYSVEAVYQGCVSQLSAPVVVIITGLKNKAQAGLRVFPNPAHGTLTVDMPKGSTHGTAQLVSADGKSVRLASALTEGANHLDVSGLARGLYLLKVISSEGVGLQSITIE